MITNLSTVAEAFTCNAYLVEGERTVLVDAGWKYDVVGEIRARVDTLDALVLTHAHPDHVGNVDDVVDAFDVDCWGYDPENPHVDREIADGDDVQLGADTYEAIFTPGHAVDHLCLYAEDEGILLSGDLVFADGAFGRTDFDGADRDTLIESIDRLIERVDPSLEVLFPGHGRHVRGDAYAHLEMARRAARSR